MVWGLGLRVGCGARGVFSDGLSLSLDKPRALLRLFGRRLSLAWVECPHELEMLNPELRKKALSCLGF